MLFNSLEFFIFFAGCFILYWFLSHSLQNRFLLVASYIFYGSWDWRFLSLIIISTLTDYYCGIKIASAGSPARKKFFLGTSIAVNLGILGVFKYTNFFINEALELFNILGFQIHYSTLNIILPIGISFYTFQTLSYTIDIYREKLKPISGFFDFALFVAFFPQLVAGPIERAFNLIPQILSKRHFIEKQVSDGFRLILWGLFIKMVIADNLAPYVDQVYAAPDQHGAPALATATYFFAFQIYCDFAGYSTIARGVARTLGIELMINFRNPYCSKSIPEFWNRWHISLSTWFRDYVYIVLGGSRCSLAKNCRNV